MIGVFRKQRQLLISFKLLFECVSFCFDTELVVKEWASNEGFDFSLHWLARQATRALVSKALPTDSGELVMGVVCEAFSESLTFGESKSFQ